MKIAIVGPGAMGLLLTGLLHKAGAEVTIIDYNTERARELNRDGIHWEGIDDNITLNIPVSTDLKDSSNIDLIILCVKAYQTENAVRSIAKDNYNGILLTLQNGVGNVETVKRHLPDASIIAGITSEGATLVSRNHVRHAGCGETAFGPIEKGRPDKLFLDQFSDLLSRSSLKTKISMDVENLIWGKLIINVGINALTGILRVRNGQLIELAPIRKLMADLVNEACLVAQAKGITLPYPNPVARVEEVCKLTSENISSMHQDILKGSVTEIDYINGAVVREGESLNVPCPLNYSITQIIHGIQEYNILH